MEIKIQCSCGSRYKFDIQPVNGRSPASLACPNCRTSWTEQANAMIAQSSETALAAVASPEPPALAVVPAALSSTATSLAVPRMGLRLSGQATRETAPPSGEAAPPAEPSSVPLPPSGRPMPRVVTLDPLLEPQHDMGSFGRGALGAALGALLGSGLYYLLFVHTEVRLKLLALGVGFLAGMGARLFSKDRSKELGAIVAILAVGTLVGTQYLVAQHWFKAEELTTPELNKSDYDDRVAEARKVIEAIPNGTDQEIRLHLAKAEAEGGKPDLKAVQREDIVEFRESELPEYRALASGKISREEYDQKNTITLSAEDRRKEKEETERTFKWVFLALTLSKFNIACMIGAAGLGYKMTADA